MMKLFRWRATTIRAAALALGAVAGQACAQGLDPTPIELKTAFESYTQHAGVDPDSCGFRVWQKGQMGAAKAMMDNAFAVCTLKTPRKVCTRLAAKAVDLAPVEGGCITGFDTLSFLPIAPMTPKGGFFVVVYSAKDRPLRLAQQLTLGFGADRDFCELSTRLIDAEAAPAAGEIFHAFLDVINDPTVCKGEAAATG
jgi:hypothetical protein